jgi:hypothetical protein
MKRTYYSAILLFFYPSFIAGMENKIVRLIPHYNDITYDNGPTIPFNAASHIQSLAIMLGDITLPTTEKEIPFVLHNCDDTTAHQLSTSLMVYHEKKDQLTTHIDSFHTDELIKLTNVTDSIDARPLELPLLVALCKAVNNKPDPILKKLNLNIQKKIATMLIGYDQYDTLLLQGYSDCLDSKIHLYNNGLLSEISGSEQLTYYFNKETQTLLNGTKKYNCMTHIHITSHNNSIVSLMKKIYGTHTLSFDLKQHNLTIDKIYQVTANNNETLFICACRNDKKFKKIVIDTINNSILQTYSDYCFGKNDHEFYVTDTRSLYSLNTSTNAIQQTSFVTDESSKITTMANDYTNTHTAIATYNLFNNISHLYMGYKKDNECTFLPITNAHNQIISLSDKFVQSLLLNKTGTVLCIGTHNPTKISGEFNYYIYDLQNFHEKIISVDNWFSFHYPPLFTQDGNLLTIPIDSDTSSRPKKYIFYNSLTHNCWKKTISRYTNVITPLTSAGEQYIEQIDNVTKTIKAITLVDNTIKRMLNHIKTNVIPLVICTIAEQKPGTLILNDEDYQEYIASPQAVQDVVNASYIITSPHWQSRLGGFMYSVYKYIRKSLFLITGLITILSVTYLLQKYTHLFNDQNKEALDAFRALLKLVSQL